jgi:transposase
MRGFIEGESREQATLLPDRLDDYVTEENPVRVIDVFVDGLDLCNLGFKTTPAVTGRPAYHPATMLKLYIYGYLNRVQSSRRLEREAGRNVELMWLLERLAPDFKTIADFRKNNSKPIQLVCREFVLLCRKLELFTEAFVAIDGSKFRAVNNRNRNFTSNKIKQRLKQIDASITRFLHELATADRQESAASGDKSERLKEKIAKLKKEVRYLNKMERTARALPEGQVSLTDPDSRAMATSGRGTGIVGYNVQSAVDTENHLIVAHEVTNVGSDRSQLSGMAEQAREALETKTLSVVADRGYYNGEELRACEESGIAVYVPRTMTSSNQAHGLFGRQDFIYKPKKDEYECPAGERLIYRCSGHDKGKVLRRYWSSACPNCALKSKCTTGVNRRISRWEHEEVMDNVEARMEQHPLIMRVRKATVEHPFGTIKFWMGSTHFQMKTLERVSGEMSLHVLAYNLKRVMRIMGVAPLVQAIRA